MPATGRIAAAAQIDPSYSLSNNIGLHMVRSTRVCPSRHKVLNGTTIGPSVLAGLTVVINTQTDTQTTLLRL